jgi:haloacetate dehalogenase
MIEGFSEHAAQVNGANIAFETGGAGPPLLLLHGFPQTRALWARVAPVLAETHTVVCPDLRGYGASSKPDEVARYAFREMARDMTALMTHLGHGNFGLAGHDRGGRVAHRLALDAPHRLTRLALLDIVPTHLILDQLSKEVATSYYHWFFLAQPEPFPEHLIGADPDFYFEASLTGWGAAQLADFAPDQLEAYRAAWRDPETIRGMCNDYRAAIQVDFEHDAEDLGRRVEVPALVAWGSDGAMGRAYDVPATWADRFDEITPASMPGGHFFVDTHPAETAALLAGFFAGA